MSAMSSVVCRMFKAGDDKRDAGLVTPGDVRRFDDICYGTDTKWQMLDVYRPLCCGDDKLPVIVSIHGGAWVYGDKERYQYYCMSLAQRGFAVVNFTYRLAPDFKFPAPLEDTNLVIKWVLDNSKEYGFDTDNIFMVGDSAGAQCLALYTSICTGTGYAENFSFKVPAKFVPKAIALNCGMAMVGNSDRKGDSTKDLLADFLEGKGTKEELDLISPALHFNADFPPVYIMTAVGDFLRDDAPKIATVLATLDVPFVLHMYGDKNNSLGHVFHCNMYSKEAAKCNDDECSFFREYIG